MAKAIAIAFWLVAGPVLGLGIIYAVGETIETVASYEPNDWRETMDEKLRCEMCATSKWKDACPECGGTGYIAVSEKIKYWWSEDRQFFCILVNDGTAQATVSLSIEEAEALMGEVQQTPRFLEFQKECEDHALKLLDEARTA